LSLPIHGCRGSDDTRRGHAELAVDAGRARRVPVPDTDTPHRIRELADFHPDRRYEET
jgi:hypothetical protein